MTTEDAELDNLISAIGWMIVLRCGLNWRLFLAMSRDLGSTRQCLLQTSSGGRLTLISHQGTVRKCCELKKWLNWLVVFIMNYIVLKHNSWSESDLLSLGFFDFILILRRNIKFVVKQSSINDGNACHSWTVVQHNLLSYSLLHGCGDWWIILTCFQ